MIIIILLIYEESFAESETGKNAHRAYLFPIRIQ